LFRKNNSALRENISVDVELELLNHVRSCARFRVVSKHVFSYTPFWGGSISYRGGSQFQVSRFHTRRNLISINRKFYPSIIGMVLARAKRRLNSDECRPITGHFLHIRGYPKNTKFGTPIGCGILDPSRASTDLHSTPAWGVTEKNFL
jgi:hypothetical protein